MKDFKRIVSILVLEPVLFGLLGFAGFYGVLYLLKGFNYITGKLSVISFSKEDFMLSFIGLAFAFLMRLIGNMKEVNLTVKEVNIKR